VLDHVAHVPITGKTPDGMWVAGMERLGRYENVYVKVSALVELAQTKPSPTDLDYYRPTLDALWRVFGADRLFYGSNWPVCERFADYATVFRLAESYFAPKGSAVEERFFATNAMRAYKPLVRDGK
jgi:L-fuconolactonase